MSHDRYLIDELELALSQAQDCLLDETPEDCTDEEAKADTLMKIREALIHNIPALRIMLGSRT